MRRGTTIFAIYLLTLSIIPCGDNGGGIIEVLNQWFNAEHEYFSDHQHHNNTCGDDSCAPFCICSCCSINTSIPTGIGFICKEWASISITILPRYFNCYLSEYLTSVWQPPKFS